MLWRVATLVLSTPEGISLERRIAGAGSRFTAATLDAGLIGVCYLLTVLFLLVILAVDVTGLSGLLIGVLLGGLPLCMAGYHLALHLIWEGQTPGKRALGLRVVSADGYPASVAQHLLRSALWPLDAFVPPLPFGVLGLFLIAGTPRHQRLGDVVAGTVVEREDADPATRDPYPGKRWSELRRRALADRPGLAARLDDQDYDYLRRLLLRGDLRAEERRGLFARTAQLYRERLELPPVEDPQALLGELYLFLRDARAQRA